MRFIRSVMAAILYPFSGVTSSPLLPIDPLHTTSSRAFTTLIVFLICVFFATHPISIPAPHPIPHIHINLTTTPILAIWLLWVTGCIDTTVIHNGIVGTDGIKPYNILILFFSLAYMAITLDIAGLLRATAFWVSNKSRYDEWKLYISFYLMFTLVSILIGNDTIHFGTGFLVYYTHAARLKAPQAWILAKFAAVNTASMVLYVGNPTNVIICEGFGLNSTVFTTYTILPFLVCNLLCFVALAAQFGEDVPRKPVPIPYRDPWSALRDNISALVGGVMVCAMLILCLILGFFGVDVWMISLPFTFTKFIFDLGRDYYQCSHGEEMIMDDDLDDELSTTNHLQTGDSSYDNKSAIQPHPVQPPLSKRFPTLAATLPRLPFSLAFFAFSQFILVEALDHQGWVDIFGDWLVRASRKEVHPIIWLIGILGIILCNVSGTNIGATILLTKVVRVAALSDDANHAAAIALAVASNIGAISFTFSASLSGLLLQDILKRKKILIEQRKFASLNLLPLSVMTVMGLGIVSAEMAFFQLNL